jgi:predicted deacylase
MGPPPRPPLPQFEVRLTAPDISPWIPGNTGIPGFTTKDSGKPGPHVAILSLMHGNEFAGAIVLDRLLRLGLAPKRGRLTVGFINLAAFERFDPRRPTLSRYVDEDINRVWDDMVLDGSRRSVELDRAREIRPLIDTVDVLLDLHSMLWPSDPLILCGETERGRTLACAIGVPELIVSDTGHLSGRRIIDYRRFSAPGSQCAANLVEAGQHWHPETVEVMLASVAGLLRHTGVAPEAAGLPAPPRYVERRLAQVTKAVTASSSQFSFVQPWRGGAVIPRRNTLIALDGNTEIRTPHDDCLLVIPSLRPSRGHTAVRLARFI